jgi:glycyl-tRNA synthetase beta chain
VPELLLELLSEEIPARMQARAAEDFKRLVCERLEKAQLTFERAEAFVTPRRLALVVDGLPERQPDAIEERRGPRVGAPFKAIEGFASALGVPSSAPQIMRLVPDQPALTLPVAGDTANITVGVSARSTDRGDFYFGDVRLAGRSTCEVVGEVLAQVQLSFPWPKSMRWGDSGLRWVRPLHNVLALFNGAPVPYFLPFGGDDALKANARTCGHRFLAPDWFEVRDFADYREKLRAAKVIVDQAERRRLILEQAHKLATAEGLRLREDEALLDEVTGLVEWPVVMLGRIDPAFMDVPAEVLITAMRAHQKYFSLLDADGRLAPRFVHVANTEGVDGGAAIVAGNERVLRARLSDAKFFWNEDRKRSLDSRIPKLAERVFHAKLGSDLQRSERLAVLARTLAPFCRADPDLAERAARLCKADLTTAMVGEFPELQGVMGRYYALHDGEPAEVADAIAEHYAPQGPSDRCPNSTVGVAVALADKLDSLAGFFAIGEQPTGTKDPFALRRAALGALRIVMENRLRLNFRPMFERALAAYPVEVTGCRSAVVSDDLLAFFADRLKVHLREQGVRHDLIAAVFAGGAEDDIVRLLARVEALRDFLDTDDGANLLVAYRRASNIVRIEEHKDNTIYDGKADERLFEEQQETELYRSLAAARASIARALSSERFGEAMAALAGLRAPVDAFFDDVTVNCANSHLRVNRLRLLSQIRSALGGVADFSQIEG